MFRRVFIQRTFHMTFLMTMCVCAAVFAGTFQIAPVNPALQEGKAAMGENYGYIPEPVDWSRLEVQGGIFIAGRHTRGAELLKEWEKLNTLASMGWRVLYCQPQDVCTTDMCELIGACLK